ncbi:hypothetical protein GUJ93_ZPchr0244g6586 [Zizania palustris]|uniref:NAC domain-containing protein n=1 Tax=Zizania palustris TaxID=103762 RepID=A0A8J5VE06_ZIZPA|nr:hypothetical protein GUJ93_ZPchr0244g6586 [Zizania palustris]
MVTVEVPATQRAAPAVAAGGSLQMLQAGLPIGFRFCLTDEKLLLHYLRREALSFPRPADIIPVANLTYPFRSPIQQPKQQQSYKKQT